MPRILYVDDEPTLLEIAKVFLEQDGQMFVDIHTSAAKAIPLAASGAYDAVISDYQMPGMDGIQFLKTVRGAGNPIPFILFTGRGREEIAIQALNEGADFYIQKGGDPVSQFAELANKVRYAVGRKQAEAALRASEEKYRQIVETSIEGIWSMNAEFVTVFVNHQMADMLGYAADEMIGHKIMEFMDPGELADNAKKLEERRRGLNDYYERRFQRKDGSSRWLGVSVTALTNPDGSFAGSFAMLTDITGRKEAEAALRASEEKYRQIVETSIEGIWSIDADLTTGFVNPKMADMLGYTVAEMLGKKMTEFMDPGELSDNEEKLAERKTGKNGFYERKFRKKDGSLRWFWVSATALKGPGGMYAGSFAMLTDITDRKLAEEELKRKNEEIGAAYEELTASEEELRQNMDELAEREREVRESGAKYRTLFDNAILGIFRSTPEGKYIDVNPAFARIAGFPSAGEMVASVTSISSLYVRQEDRQRLKEQLAAEGEVRNFETEIRHTDGSAIWVAVNARAFRNETGKILWYDGTIEDITPRKHAERELSLKTDELQASHEEITATEEELRHNYELLAEREKTLRKTADELENQNRLISTILDTTPLGIFMVEAPSGKPVIANPEAIRLLGRGILPDATEKNLSEVYEAYRIGTGQRYPPQEMPIIRGMNGETSRIDDMEVLRPDGTRVRLEIFGNPVRDNQGKIIASLVTFLDITDRKT